MFGIGQLMTNKNADDTFDAAETKRRFEDALRGARLAGPKPNESLIKKKPKVGKAKKKPAAKRD
jgi:hypothetical protein